MFLEDYVILTFLSTLFERIANIAGGTTANGVVVDHLALRV